MFFGCSVPCQCDDGDDVESEFQIVRTTGPSSPLHEVVAHVYDIISMSGLNDMMNYMGTGIYHVGIEVFGREWSFGELGMFYGEPAACPGQRHREALSMGLTNCTKDAFLQLLQDMLDEWNGNTYDVINHNCVHFSETLCQRLGVGRLPDYVKNMAGAGASLKDNVTRTVNFAEAARKRGRQTASAQRRFFTGRLHKRMRCPPTRSCCRAQHVARQLWFLVACVPAFCSGLAAITLPSIHHHAAKKGGVDESNSATNHGQVAIADETASGVVHFLFLVNSSLHHVRLWRRFFSRAPPGSWRAWVHCADADACRRSGLFEAFPDAEQVPTVPQAYCTDLVTAPVELLRHALAAKAAPEGAVEKFALVSDSTLPVKPYSEVYRTLIGNKDSDFCVAPASEWRGAHVDAIKVFLIKHSQWFVLNREHAQVLVDEWTPARGWDSFMGWWNVPLKGGSWAYRARRLVPASRFLSAPGGSYACTDEQAVFATIFGAFEPDRGGGRKYYNGFGELSMNEANTPQGRCRTFTVFQNTKDLGNLTDTIMDVVTNDTATSTFHHEDPSHPLLLTCAGRQTLKALRASPFLFARKFGPSGNDDGGSDDPQADPWDEEPGTGAGPCGDGASYAAILLQDGQDKESIVAAREGQLESWGYAA